MKITVKDIYFVFVLVFSGRALPFYASQQGIILLFIITLAIMLYYKLGVTKQFTRVLAVWAFYSIAVTLVNGSFNQFFIFRHFVYFTVAYTLISLYRERLFLIYEKSIYYFAFTSLFFVTWEFLSKDTLSIFMGTFDIANYADGYKRNIIVYTQEMRYTYIFPRNCGFTWEPGPFSIYISIAMLINLLRNNLKIRKNRPLLIMFLALITTQSTTGFMAFGAFVVYLILRDQKGVVKAVYALAALSIFIYTFFTFDFMYDKISRHYGTIGDYEQRISHAATYGGSITGGRAMGFMIGWEDFKRHPLLGIGGATELSYGYIDEQASVFIVNGIASVMSTYGMFGLIMYLLLAYKTSLFLHQHYKSKARYGFFIIIILSSFGFSLHSQTILLSLILFSAFQSKNHLQPSIKAVESEQ